MRQGTLRVDRPDQVDVGTLGLAILGSLSRQTSAYGYTLLASLAKIGFAQVKAGTVYPLLAGLEAQGLVGSGWVTRDAGPVRRYFWLTEAGREVLEAARPVMRGAEGGAATALSFAATPPTPTAPAPSATASPRMAPAELEPSRAAVDVWTYSRVLAEQLRTNGVRERRVREIVAQVQEHVLSTGETSMDAFGPPVAYARAWRPLHWVSWLLRLGSASLGVLGVLAIFTSADPVEGTGWTENVHITASEIGLACTWVLAGVVMPGTVGIMLSRQRARLLGHPNHRGVMRSIHAVVLGVLLVLAVPVAWLGLPDLPELSVSQPRWLLLGFGLLALPGLWFWGFPSRVLPGPPRTPWTTQVRRFVS